MNTKAVDTVHNPVQRILELLMPGKDIEALFRTTKSKITVHKSAGVMGKFLSAGKQKAGDGRCDVCGVQTSPGTPLCKTHKPQAVELAAEARSSLAAATAARDSLYATCHACAGHDRAVLCSNMECPVYFARTGADAAYSKASSKSQRSMAW